MAREAPPGPEAEFAVSQIGSGGDGVVQLERGGRLHIARSLPGERVLARPQSGPGAQAARATLSAILSSSPDRVMPPCPHFNEGCGGCALQHWSDGAYAAWKRGLVVAALQSAGFADPQVAPLIRTPPHTRRRMDFAVQRREGGVLLGLHQAHSRTIIDLVRCEILHPALLSLLPPLRLLLTSLAALRRAGSLIVNLLDSGPDLLLRTDGPLAATDRAKLAAFASAHGVARIAWALGTGPAETAAQNAAPFITFAGTRVAPPPGAFLQASAEGERAIVQAVLEGLPARLAPRARAVELFAGCGTLSFPLAQHLRVQAYEGDGLAATAVRRAQAGTLVEMAQRDLARQPLSARELSGATVIVLDPPYGGVPMQVPQIAASGVPRVIYVSCNPGALARDAAMLAQAGYSLLRATGIDQFLWSAQVECVAVFGR